MKKTLQHKDAVKDWDVKSDRAKNMSIALSTLAVSHDFRQKVADVEDDNVAGLWHSDGHHFKKLTASDVYRKTASDVYRNMKRSVQGVAEKTVDHINLTIEQEHPNLEVKAVSYFGNVNLMRLAHMHPLSAMAPSVEMAALVRAARASVVGNEAPLDKICSLSEAKAQPKRTRPVVRAMSMDTSDERASRRVVMAAARDVVNQHKNEITALVYK